MPKIVLKERTLQERFTLLYVAHEKLMQSYGKLLEHVGNLTQRVVNLENPESVRSIDESRRH
jgi:hypothetical protein